MRFVFYWFAGALLFGFTQVNATPLDHKFDPDSCSYIGNRGGMQMPVPQFDPNWALCPKNGLHLAVRSSKECHSIKRHWIEKRKDGKLVYKFVFDEGKTVVGSVDTATLNEGGNEALIRQHSVGHRLAAYVQYLCALPANDPEFATIAINYLKQFLREMGESCEEFKNRSGMPDCAPSSRMLATPDFYCEEAVRKRGSDACQRAAFEMRCENYKKKHGVKDCASIRPGPAGGDIRG